MKRGYKTFSCLLICAFFATASASANIKDNQTADLSPVLPATGLPFQIKIEQVNFQLPVGIHSGVYGKYKGLWIFIAGRTNGLHGFDPGTSFPPDAQNKTVYVVNPLTGVTTSRSLEDASSGLTQEQINTLSVTSPEGYQEGNTLYMAGGYQFDSDTSTYKTQPVLTAINLSGIVDWVMHPENTNNSVAQNIQQIYNSEFQVTGGKMLKLGSLTQLVFGQDMEGPYTVASNGQYTKQVRRFQIKNTGQLAVDIESAMPETQDPNFRRRDLNVVPTLLNKNGRLQYGLIAFSGVFTTTSGVWTVPVVIDGVSNPTMADPAASTTFKQAMNHYESPTVSLYSGKYGDMYHIIMGGISYGYYSGGVFETDSEIPFINQVTTIKMDKNGNFSQYLMDNQYPVILSTQSNPGNTLLFGAAAYFIQNTIQQYPNAVINLDGIRQETVIGYIVGGIQSTLANTNVMSDSSASPYVFKVTLVPLG